MAREDDASMDLHGWEGRRMRFPGVFARVALGAALVPLLAAAPGAAMAGRTGDGPARQAASTTAIRFVNVADPDLTRLKATSFVYVTEGRGVIVALAECRNEACTEVLRSTDGLAWDVVTRLPGWSAGIAWTDNGFLVAQNDNRRRRQVLFHSGDGLGWEEIPLEGPDYFEGIASGPGGYLLIGCDRDCERSVLWWSEDGRSWSRDREFRRRARLTDVATNGTTLVGIADPTLRFSGGMAVALTDVGWVDLELPLPEGPTGPRGDVADVAALADGSYVILGVQYGPKGEDPILFTSRDGTTWTSTDPDVEPAQPRTRLAPQSIGSAAGLTAFDVLPSGRRARQQVIQDASHIVWSMGMEDWRLAALPTPHDTMPFVRDLVVTEDGVIVAVGSSETAARIRPAIWIGRG
jgi:hypothetical protein